MGEPYPIFPVGTFGRHTSNLLSFATRITYASVLEVVPDANEWIQFGRVEHSSILGWPPWIWMAIKNSLCGCQVQSFTTFPSHRDGIIPRSFSICFLIRNFFCEPHSHATGSFRPRHLAYNRTVTEPRFLLHRLAMKWVMVQITATYTR